MKKRNHRWAATHDYKKAKWRNGEIKPNRYGCKPPPCKIFSEEEKRALEDQYRAD